MKITESLIEQFCEAASQHAASTESGDYKQGNKAHQRIVDALQQLDIQQATKLLRPLLQNPNVGTRLWAAAYLLRSNAFDAEASLEAIAAQADIHSFNAQMTLKEWRAGRLRPLF